MRNVLDKSLRGSQNLNSTFKQYIPTAVSFMS